MRQALRIRIVLVIEIVEKSVVEIASFGGKSHCFVGFVTPALTSAGVSNVPSQFHRGEAWSTEWMKIVRADWKIHASGQMCGR